MTEPGPPELIPLPSSEYARAGELLGAAFADDLLWQATFLESDLSESLVAMFTAVTKATVAARGVAQTTRAIEAVALWLPPGKDLGFWSMVRSGFVLPRFVTSLPASDRNRMMAVLRQLREREKALMPDPHWHLTAIGVDPSQQGAGLGSRLVQSGIVRADRENVAIYLETETEANVAFYEHRGFAVVEEVAAVGLGVPIWLMVRRAPGRN